MQSGLKQAYLEKKVEAHDKLLGDEICTDGMVVVQFKDNR